ncbi:hypothetical protein GPECTOR_4g986 [Gonium pectorale]|uniref:Uncharacterized protein n=1 Tax=Gonium pectorale TaxID=33097 RepID=A0A150GYP3_GONPE|nr:hypothetical protein GPECTOR_4g986 [Gonium pectorale]|eukprot:KXZ54914.1 hypothetical protein GPECTOR_4g986 [Gonium pectorale]
MAGAPCGLTHPGYAQGGYLRRPYALQLAWAAAVWRLSGEFPYPAVLQQRPPLLQEGEIFWTAKAEAEALLPLMLPDAWLAELGSGEGELACEQGARALTKHTHRDLRGEWWPRMSGSEAAKNALARGSLSRLLGEALWLNVHQLPPFSAPKYVLEVRNPQADNHYTKTATKTVVCNSVSATRTVSLLFRPSTTGARALTKHTHRDLRGEWWPRMSGSEAAKNALARGSLSRLLGEALWLNVHQLPPFSAPKYVLEVRNPQAIPSGKYEITLRGQEALQTMRFGLVPQGKGQAVVVTGVAEGSRAEELGVRRGQKLNALSDPMRYGTMWSLEDRPSLRFVVDTFKMRRSQPIDLEFEPLLSEADMATIFGSADATAAAAGSYSGSASPIAPSSASSSVAAGAGAAAASSRGDRDLDMQPDGAAASINSIDQLMGTTSGSESDSDSAGMTIGERLAAKRAAALKAQMANNQVQARIERRKAYMEIDDQRDDTGLILGLAAAFLLPALVILVIAYFTGYLDRLYLTALTLR